MKSGRRRDGARVRGKVVRRLRYDELSTACQGRYVLCVIPGLFGPVFYCRRKERMRPVDWRRAVDWDVGTQMLQDNGLTIGLDKAEEAHIRYVDEAARKAGRENRRRMRLYRAEAARGEVGQA